MILTAGKDDDGRRLDRILRRALPDLPLSAIHRILRRGGALVNGVPAGASRRISAGAEIRLPAVDGPGPRKAGGPDRAAAAPGLDILWEGAGLLALNKPPGLAVHGGSRNGGKRTGGDSLERRAAAFLADTLPPSLSFRPGPLHRLDRPTSGVIVFSVSLEGARRFSALLREGRIRKRYLAILEGELRGAAFWEDRLYRDKAAGKTFTADGAVSGAGGVLPEAPPPDAAPPGEPDGPAPRRALTRARPLACSRPGGAGKGYTLAALEIETGRTHQIRAQAAARGHPLAGDRKYGGGPLPPSLGIPKAGGFFLHAAELTLPEIPGEERNLPRTIAAPPPESFVRAAEELFGPTARDILFP